MAPTVPQDQTNGGASDAPVDMVVSDDSTKKTKRSASEKKKKSDVDYDKLEKDIAEHTGSVAKDHAKHAQAIEALLALEKTYRLQADLKATSMCCVAVVQTCFEAKEWKLLNENVVLISKRRAQLKQAVGATVTEAIGFIDQTPDEDTKIELIKTLQSVTEGKIYLELERARLTRRLASILESRGKIEEAATTLQEVAVETFGAMAKTEKIAFIMEQVRLCLDKKDFIRAFILIKKVSPRAFAVKKLKAEGDAKDTKEMALDGTAAAAPDVGIPSLEELKLVYYEHLIQYYRHTDDALEICRCYQNIYDTPLIKNDALRCMEVLKKICWYIVLASPSPMQKTILHTVDEDPKVAEMPIHKKLLAIFVKNDIVQWTEVESQFAGEMMEQDAIFSGDKGVQNRDLFKLRVVDHNILVVSQYYSQVTLKRLADILKITTDETEKYLSDLVLKKTVKAKINRLEGVVTFGAKPTPDEVLTKWSKDVAKLLDILETSCHKIGKECQQYGVSVPSMNV